MQHSLYEIKETLLQALDHEYNVVDMDAVFDVITALEKAIITKEALEKTRIGRYINALRKRTSNEQLARRAKDLVRSWRKLLPLTPRRLNGEDISNSIIASPGVITMLGPGPGPGIGPGPGPGYRIKTPVSLPGTPRYKTSSPSVMGERSSSPYFSSASNSPLLNSSVLQGSNLQPMPSNYAPVNCGSCHSISEADTACVNKTFLITSNQSKNNIPSQNFKPVSPSAVKHDIVSGGTYVWPRTSLCDSPRQNNKSSSSSPLLTTPVNVCSPNKSPSEFMVAHSSLDIAKTNAANKRLRKETQLTSLVTTEDLTANDTTIKIGNGISDCADGQSLCNSKPVQHEAHIVVSDTENRKRSFDNKKELQETRLESMLACMHSGSKLPKVKTTRQLIADLQARKGFTTILPDSLVTVNTLHSTEAEVSRTKSELLKKFLISSQSTLSRSPLDESNVSVISDHGSCSVPDVSVINTNLDINTSGISYSDPVDEEIKRILSALPPISPTDINPDVTTSSPKRPRSITDDLNRLQSRWEFVNGVYDCNGTWREWEECSEQKSYLEESLQILPYVNID